MVEHYLLIKQIHQGSALLSIGLFLLRGAWMIRWPHLLRARPVRIAPHVVDTVLLASAVLLAWMARQYPFVHDWLTAKVVALIVYIVLGSIALKRGRTLGIRITALVAAVLTFGYIVAVAVTKQAAPW